MFPRAMALLVDEATPKLNPILANGIAVMHLKKVEEYVDSIFKSAASGFPPGLLYTGCCRCTPQQEFNEITRKKGNRCVFDVARSDVYLMEYKFTYQGVPLPSKYLFLPFVEDAGVIYLSGSRYVISPILSDRVISIGIANVFVRLLKAKLTFNREPHHFKINGVREDIQVAWSSIYNEKPNSNAPKATVKANCTLAHYLFCKHGFTQTFKKYANCDPIVGGLEIDHNTYPGSEWLISYSSQMKPKGFGKSFYEPSDIRVAIRRDQYTPMVKNLLGGFFYCVDMFPTRIKPEYVDDNSLWMILLGHIIWSGNISSGKLFLDVQDHISSLDEYIDSIVSSKLKDIGYQCTDIYQLFALILDRFNDWLLTSEDRVNTMYDKELSVLYYVCYEISSSIFKLYFKLKAAQKKELNAKKIIRIMNLNLRTGAIFRINRDHGEVTTTSSSGDNKALKTTILLVQQSSSSRNKSKKDRLAISDPAKRMHASIAEVGAVLATPKSEPSGRSRLSLHVNINHAGLIVRNPKHQVLLDNVQAQFKR
jgi:hypothetical protein